MTRNEFASIEPGTEVIWNATDERGYHHDLKAVFIRRGAVQIRIKTRDGIETWTNARNLRLTKGNPPPCDKHQK